MVFTALWGYPFLVRAEHYPGTRASFTLGLVVVSSIVSAPFVGLLIVRAPRARSAVVVGTALVLLAAWTAVLSWSGPVPAVLVVMLAITTGVGGSTSVIAFDFAREANPPERGEPPPGS